MIYKIEVDKIVQAFDKAEEKGDVSKEDRDSFDPWISKLKDLGLEYVYLTDEEMVDLWDYI